MDTFAIDLGIVPARVRPVIANQLLAERPTRTPDSNAQVDATTSIIRALRETPTSVLAKLSEAVKELTHADSAGVSLSGRDDGEQIFLWQAAVGLFEKYLGSVVIHDESPCECVLDTDATLLMVNPGTVYKTAALVEPPIREVLLVPFYVDGRTVEPFGPFPSPPRPLMLKMLASCETSLNSPRSPIKRWSKWKTGSF